MGNSEEDRVRAVGLAKFDWPFRLTRVTCPRELVVDSESELRRLWAAHVRDGLSYRRRRRRRLGYEISQGQVGYVSLQGTWTRLNKANSSHPLEFRERDGPCTPPTSSP